MTPLRAMMMLRGRCRLIAALVLLGASAASSANDKLSLTSTAFANGGTIPAQFTCKGANVSPALELHGVPAEAKSLALVIEDADAPSGLFTHWLAWNITPTTTQLRENSVPTGAVQGMNDFGKVGYGGPCPPSGTHRYVFRLLALNSSVSLAVDAKRAEFDRATRGHVIGQAELIGRVSAR